MGGPPAPIHVVSAGAGYGTVIGSKAKGNHRTLMETPSGERYWGDSAKPVAGHRAVNVPTVDAAKAAAKAVPQTRLVPQLGTTVPKSATEAAKQPAKPGEKASESTAPARDFDAEVARREERRRASGPRERSNRPYTLDPATGLLKFDFLTEFQHSEPGAKPSEPALKATRSAPIRKTKLSELPPSIAAKLLAGPAWQTRSVEISEVPGDLLTTFAGAIKGALDAGVPAHLFDQVDGFHSYSSGGDAIIVATPDGKRSLGLRISALEAARDNVNGWGEWMAGGVAHEVGHVVAANPRALTGNDFTVSAPGFIMGPPINNGNTFGRPTGDIMYEGYQLWVDGDSDLSEFLSYPFTRLLDRSPKDLDTRFFPEEFFAQSYSLYHMNPALMREKMPLGFALQERLHNELRREDSANGAGIARAAREVLGSVQDVRAGAVGVGQSVGRGQAKDQASVGDEATASGVGQPGEGAGVKPRKRKPFALAEPTRANLAALEGLTQDEKDNLTSHSANNFVRWFTKLPSVKNFAAIAWAGRAKRGWYKASAKALVAVFGVDAPRFAALLAATSPQTSVEANLENALRIWRAWVNAGRPQGRSQILRITFENVIKKDASDPGVLGAWENNSVRALTHPDPGALVISGPKVNSFFANLVGITSEVTNDAWMSAFARVDAELLGGTLSAGERLYLDQPGKGPVYLAMSARARLAAKTLSKLTGDQWTPDEVQETIWSWAKALSEESDRRRATGEDVTAEDIVRRAELDDKLIAAVPDFSSLLLEPKYAAILEEAGYSDRLVDLSQHHRDYAQEKSDADARLASQAPPFARADQLREEVAAARRIDLKRTDPLGKLDKVIPGEFSTNTAMALKRPGWAIITATVGDAKDPKNVAANNALRQRLIAAGVRFEEVEGWYNKASDGVSFLMYQQNAKTTQTPLYTSEADAIKLGAELGQIDVLTNKGYIRTADKMLLPANQDAPYIGSKARKQPGYTVLSDGTAFSTNLPPFEDKNRIPLADYNLWKQVDHSKDARKVKLDPTVPLAEREDDGAWEVGRESVGDTKSDRATVVESTDLKGDGRVFTPFFTAASEGKRAPNANVKYEPVIDISSLKDFSDAYTPHRGNFDDHIATSIPGFREVQQAVGDAIVKTYANHSRQGSATLLDIAASEGAFNKAITQLSDGKIFTLALDPNLAMAKFFAEHSQVEGADYDVSAFGSKDEEGKLAWTEDDGTKIKYFKPIEKYDVVHEAMGFQFISNTRNAQFARVKELMEPNGIALFEEKIKDDTDAWRANEKQKDAYKAKYFTAKQMEEKAAEVLDKGAAASAEEDSKREQAVVGMNDLMTTSHELETALTNNWKHVVQYWDSGNFKGYVASDDPRAISRFLGNLVDLNSEYSTVATPRAVNADDAMFGWDSSRAGAEAEKISEARGDAHGFAPGMTPAQRAALEHVGVLPVKQPLAARLSAVKKGLADRLVTGIVDSFHPLKALDPTGETWELAMLSKATSGGLEALMRYGNISLVDRTQFSSPTGGKGFRQTLKDLRGEEMQFLAWVAANRAEMLMAEGREHLFTRTEIAEIQGLAAGNMKDGRVRLDAYKQANEEMQAINRQVLDLAEDSGMIDPDSRATWEKDFYLPFYRVLEDDPTQTIAIGKGRGLVGQQAFQRLKGGTDKLASDLLGNIERNWSHILDASARNRAAQSALDWAEAIGDATQVGGPGKGVKFYMEGGKKKHYIVHNEMVLTAITGLERIIDPAYLKWLTIPKQMITIGATADPTFVIRNGIRDTMSAIAQSGISVNVAKNIGQGLAMAVNEQNATHAAALAAGGIIHFGTMTDGQQGDYYSRLIREGTQPWTVLNSPAKVTRAAWNWWSDVRGYSEDMNRLSLIKQMGEKGASYRSQMVAGRNLLNFTQSGAWPVVQFLIKIVPFLNAGVQGLYRISHPSSKARFAVVLLSLAAAEIALNALYADDDDWKKRKEFDKQNYFWFKVGDIAYRIPKPFEIGSIATLAGNTFSAATDDEMDSKRYWSGFRSLLANSLRLDPTPQLLRPIMDVQSNVDFSGGHIETQAMEGLPKSERFGPRTSDTAKLLGQLAPAQEFVLGKGNALSPVQIDSLARGYFGWLGTMALVASDSAVNLAQDKPPSPDWQLRDVPTVGKFVETVPTNSSRYSDVFYDQAVAIREAYTAYRAKLKAGDKEGAAEWKEAHGDLIKLQPTVARYSEMLALDRAAIRRVEQSRDLDGEQKREKLDALYERMNRTVEKAARATAPQ